MQIKQQITISTSADKVWEFLGHQYDRVAEWASSVHASQGRNNGVVPQNAPCSGRVCETDLGGFKETITHYDERGKSISYSAQGDKMPFFVKQLANTWTVTPLSNSKFKVDMCMEVSIMVTVHSPSKKAREFRTRRSRKARLKGDLEENASRSLCP